MSLFSIALTAGLAAAPPEQPPPLVRIAPQPLVRAAPAVPVAEPEKAEERLMERMADGSAAEKAAAAEEMQAHPEKVNPFGLLPLITYLLDQGDWERATFWYYFWQQRSRPWARLGTSDGEAALRGSVIATLGPVVNEWAGSDPLAMRDLMVRAWRFERRAPLYPGRPAGVSEADWAKTVAEERAVNDPEEVARGYPANPTDLESNAAERRRNHLYVGPWQHRGRPLMENWR